jgi:hypothetical protein
MRTRLRGLSDVLTDLAAALESGRADEVLAMEERVAAVIAEARAAVIAASPGSVRVDEVVDLVAVVRDQMSRCRRLGSTVPALLSVMYPGQVGYGPAGTRVPGGASVRPGLTQVI